MKYNYIFVLILLVQCTTFDEAGKVLRNEKINQTDEFLIEKRGPLSLPPDMGELPKPRSKKSQSSQSNNIKKTLGNLSEESLNTKEKSRLEKIILEEIKN